VVSSKTVTAAVPRPRQPTFPGPLKSSGVSNSDSVITPMLTPPGMQPLGLRPFQTPPPCLSTNSRTVTPSGNSTQPGLFTWPLMQYNFGPKLPASRGFLGSGGTPIDLNHSTPRSMICVTHATVSMLLTTVGLRNAPSTAGNGGLMRGQARLPSRL